jgi:hypothetical protein
MKWMLLLLAVAGLGFGSLGCSEDGTDTSGGGTGTAGTTGTTGAPGYSIVYNGNGHSAGTVPIDPATYESGAPATVLGDTGKLLNIDGETTAYRFLCWNTKADGSGTDYSAGDSIPVGSANVTLYAKWVAYALRDTGPARGLVFHDKGSYSDGWRYMEAAPSDQATSVLWSNITTVAVSGTGRLIGNGRANTQAIISQSGHVASAAKICADLVLNGYDDWFLPSQNELIAMYDELKKKGVGDFASYIYWTSSQYASQAVWAYVVDFIMNMSTSDYKDSENHVRAVRTF